MSVCSLRLIRTCRTHTQHTVCLRSVCSLAQLNAHLQSARTRAHTHTHTRARTPSTGLSSIQL